MSPKNNNKQVSAAVRILHQKRDASARATHLMVKNDPLITYEKAFLDQAAVKKFFIATFLERKTMSTKTITKRIALVAASALAIGGFSVISAPQASAANAGTAIFTVTGATGTTTNTATISKVTGTYLSALITFNGTVDNVNTITSTGVGTILVPVIAASDSGTATTGVTSTGATVFASQSATSVPGSSAAAWTLGDKNGTSAGVDTATVSISATSATAGTQTITVTGSVGISTLVITWGAAPAPSIAASTVYFLETTTAVEADVHATVFTADSTGALLNTAGAQRGLIRVLVNNDQTPAAGVDGEAISVTVSGVGLVKEGTGIGTGQAATDTTANGGYAIFTVSGSGVAGTGVYTVSHTSATGVTTVLATKSISFYATTPTKISAVQNNFVAAAGSALGGTTSAATGSGAFTVTATDNNSNKVSGISVSDKTGSATAAGWWIVSSDTTCISSTISANLFEGTGATATNNAKGVYELTIAGGVATATSGCSADVEIKYTAPTTLTVMSAGKFKVAVGGTSISTLTVTPTSESVKPGEKVTLTLAALDSKGNKVADGAYGIFAAPAATAAAGGFAGLVPSASLVANPFAVDSSTTMDITIVNGVKTATFFAPYFTGDVILSQTLAASSASLATALLGSTLTTTVSVDATDGNASLALDAANAATDAANNAYDEAQNATQAASDALAAVTALAKQVKTLIANVKKLTKAVAKLS